MTQYQITCDHYRNAYKIEPDHVKLKVLDRCALDGTVYCRYFAQYKTRVSDMVLDVNGDLPMDWSKVTTMSKRYLPDMMEKYDILFYTDPKDVPLVDDGERSASVMFRDGIISLFEDYISKKMYKDKVVILSGTVEQRLNRIQEAIKERDSSINLKIRN